MVRFEPVVIERKPDLVLAYGDVNSTVATALVCARLGLRVGHVETCLRSFDRTMPEEINRLVIDQLAELLFTPPSDGDQNLREEWILGEKIFRVGSVMIDSLCNFCRRHKKIERDGLHGWYAPVTLHRPANVDESATPKAILESLREVNRDL